MRKQSASAHATSARTLVGSRHVTSLAREAHAESKRKRLAADRANDSELQHLQRIVDASEKATNQRDVEKMMLFDREFHDTLARAARNTVLADVLRSLHERSLRFWFISLRDPDHHRNVLAQHRAIVAALQSRQPDAAENAMREHILAFQRNVTRQV